MMLSRREPYGNCCIATQDIKRGTLIMTENPLVFVPILLIKRPVSKQEEFYALCGGDKCGKLLKDDVYTCHKCLMVFFCSMECCSSFDRIHSLECTGDKSLIRTSNVKLLMRVLAVGINLVKTPLKNKQASEDSIDSDEKEDLSEVNKRFCKIYSESFIRESFLIIKANSVSVHSFLGRWDYAKAIYLISSYLTHSCVPNCFLEYNGLTLSLHANVDIPKGKVLTVCKYEDLMLMRYHERKVALSRCMGMVCHCALCKYEEENGSVQLEELKDQASDSSSSFPLQNPNLPTSIPPSSSLNKFLTNEELLIVMCKAIHCPSDESVRNLALITLIIKECGKNISIYSLASLFLHLSTLQTLYPVATFFLDKHRIPLAFFEHVNMLQKKRGNALQRETGSLYWYIWSQVYSTLFLMSKKSSAGEKNDVEKKYLKNLLSRIGCEGDKILQMDSYVNQDFFALLSL